MGVSVVTGANRGTSRRRAPPACGRPGRREQPHGETCKNIAPPPLPARGRMLELSNPAMESS